MFHNLALISFNAWTFVSIMEILYIHGFVSAHNFYFGIEDFEKAIYRFYLSKYYEFFDTYLLYLLGKQPSFLQTYYHSGALVSWHLTYIYKNDSIWIPSLTNSFVNVIMYSYYLGSLLRIFNMKQIKIIRSRVRLLQISQLIGTVALSNYYYDCENNQIMCVMNAYNIFLICLIISFYQKTDR